MTKSNIRSIRFSDDMADLISRQMGRTFTEKFENLVTRCVWELPKKEAELERLQQQIERERQRLRELEEKRQGLQRAMAGLSRALNECIYSAGETIEQLKKL